MSDTKALPIARLAPGDDFRLDEDLRDLDELAGSIAELGVLQPLIVRPNGSGWEVVAGRRRLAAARIAGLTKVPCTVRDLSDSAAVDITIAENLHRRNLSPIEEGLAYAQLTEQGLKQAQIAQRVGRSQAHVSRLLRVLELPEALRQKIHRGEMSYATALDRWGRKTYRRGGVSTQGKLGAEDAALVSHWRRRHDRLIAGIHAVLDARPVDEDHWRTLLDRLLKLDRQPLDEIKESA